MSHNIDCVNWGDFSLFWLIGHCFTFEGMFDNVYRKIAFASI